MLSAGPQAYFRSLLEEPQCWREESKRGMQSLSVSTSTQQALRVPCLEGTELRDLNPGALIQRGEVSGPRSLSTMKASGNPFSCLTPGVQKQ